MDLSSLVSLLMVVSEMAIAAGIWVLVAVSVYSVTRRGK